MSEGDEAVHHSKEGGAEPHVDAEPPLPPSELDEPPEASLEEPPDTEVDDLRRVTTERDEYRDTLLRVQADFENYRKRILRQQTVALEQAAETLVVKLLPVMDALDLAAVHHPDVVEPLRSALWSVLESEGVERIEPTRETFDPTSSEAVEHEAGEGPEVVAETMRPGYRLKGRLLRPALVKVRNGEVSAERR